MLFTDEEWKSPLPHADCLLDDAPSSFVLGVVSLLFPRGWAAYIIYYIHYTYIVENIIFCLVASLVRKIH